MSKVFYAVKCPYCVGTGRLSDDCSEEGARSAKCWHCKNGWIMQARDGETKSEGELLALAEKGDACKEKNWLGTLVGIRVR